jgi:hypothetical protein
VASAGRPTSPTKNNKSHHKAAATTGARTKAFSCYYSHQQTINKKLKKKFIRNLKVDFINWLKIICLALVKTNKK